jgi:hypothetical protein
MMTMDDYPVQIFSLIKDYLICLSTQSTMYVQMKQNAKSWMNFCNCSKKQQEIKSFCSCYFLSTVYSVAYLSHYVSISPNSTYLSTSIEKSSISAFLRLVVYDLITSLILYCQINPKTNLFLDFRSMSNIKIWESKHFFKLLIICPTARANMNFHCVVGMRWIELDIEPPSELFHSLKCYSIDLKANAPNASDYIRIPYLEFKFISKCS